VYRVGVLGKGGRGLGGREIGDRCEVVTGGEAVEGARWLMEGDDYRSYKDGELFDRDSKQGSSKGGGNNDEGTYGGTGLEQHRENLGMAGVEEE
jgi:hypothetical protein